MTTNKSLSKKKIILNINSWVASIVWFSGIMEKLRKINFQQIVSMKWMKKWRICENMWKSYQKCALYYTGFAKNFFLENTLKKSTKYLLKFRFYLKAQSFRLIMENNFIQTAVSAGHAVAYTIVSIFKHIIDYVQLYFTNGYTNIVL